MSSVQKTKYLRKHIGNHSVCIATGTCSDDLAAGERCEILLGYLDPGDSISDIRFAVISDEGLTEADLSLRIPVALAGAGLDGIPRGTSVEIDDSVVIDTTEENEDPLQEKPPEKIFLPLIEQ